jgi:YD repeat-containing protein
MRCSVLAAALVGLLIAGAAVASSRAQTLTYSYDAVGRMTGAALGTGPGVAYTHDRSDNRTSRTTSAGSGMSAGPAPSASRAAVTPSATRPPPAEPPTPVYPSTRRAR